MLAPRTATLALYVRFFAQFGVKCIVSVINVSGPLYHILLSTPEECDALAGHHIRLSFSQGTHTLWRAPYSIAAISAATNGKKRRGADLDMDAADVASKRPKLGESSDSNLPSVFQPYSAFARPTSTAPVQSPSCDDHFVVERVLHQRWIQGKVQYLLQLKGDNSSIRVWMFDEDLFAEVDMNRKQANLWNALQTGKYPDTSQLPEVEQILGAKMVGSQLMFYVKWSNSSVFALVPSTIVNKAAPAKVIQFYEARLTFEPTGEVPSLVSSPSTSETQAQSTLLTADSKKVIAASSIPMAIPT